MPPISSRKRYLPLGISRHGARGTGRREREQFHDLAFAVARAAFSPTIRDTTFEYFAQMGKFVESGPFDADPGSGFAPATDESTFNGSIWALARRTFLSNPDSIPDPASPTYQRAIAFYGSRAVGPNFQWSWLGAELGDAFVSGRLATRDRSAVVGMEFRPREPTYGFPTVEWTVSVTF